jgi:hypothetical protein
MSISGVGKHNATATHTAPPLKKDGQPPAQFCWKQKNKKIEAMIIMYIERDINL